MRICTPQGTMLQRDAAFRHSFCQADGFSSLNCLFTNKPQSIAVLFPLLGFLFWSLSLSLRLFLLLYMFVV